MNRKHIAASLSDLIGFCPEFDNVASGTANALYAARKTKRSKAERKSKCDFLAYNDCGVPPGRAQRSSTISVTANLFSVRFGADQHVRSHLLLLPGFGESVCWPW